LLGLFGSYNFQKSAFTTATTKPKAAPEREQTTPPNHTIMNTTTSTHNSDATARGEFSRSTYVAVENSLNSQQAAASVSPSASASHNIREILPLAPASYNSGTSFIQTMDRIKFLRNKINTWSDSVIIDVAESMESDTIIEIDIMGRRKPPRVTWQRISSKQKAKLIRKP
jgi:hypothetical protein